MQVSLASVKELESPQFRAFMDGLNQLAEQFHLRIFTNWSKVWEYPWLWFHGLNLIEWRDKKVCDLGSELSSMPWYLASLGASVTLIESDPQYEAIWKSIRENRFTNVHWRINKDEQLPFEDSSFDVVTSFSVIEHQQNKILAVNEIARVLKPGGVFALSFDICEPSMGMTFPEWNGDALTMQNFEDIIWNHPAFTTGNASPQWNIQDIPDFIRWHLQSAPHHNYTTGAALLIKEY